jgi:hypothetical protein
MKYQQSLKALLPCLVVLFLCLPASASITLYDKEGTTFSTDGSFNTFYVYSSSENEIAGTERDQSRIKMGFLPNWIGFNFSKQVNGLKLGGRSSFWVTINDSDTTGGPERTYVTETGIDVRQFYGTVDAKWGQVLIGKDFSLFSRSNIFLDEILLGYGNVSDTLGLIDGKGVSFGNIGTGYLYPTPTAQITYRTPDLGGFKLAVGLLDPSRTSGGGGEESAPRFEGELTYSHSIGKGSLTAWTGFLYQSSETTTGVEVDSKGIAYGLQAKLAGISLTASGFDGSGLGLLLGPGGDTGLGLPFFFENGDEVDSNGYLLQGSYTYGPAKVALSYGKNELDLAEKWENETATGAVFFAVNSNLKLVAEYNVNTISIGTPEEETKTVALGGIINF